MPTQTTKNQGMSKKSKKVSNKVSDNKVSKNGDELTIDDIYKVIDLYFKQKNVMFTHLYNSFDKFLDEDIPQLLKGDNSIFFEKVTKDKVYRYKFKYDDISIKPPMADSDDEILFPSVARTRSLTYSIKLVATITQIQEVIDIATDEVTTNVIGTPEYEYPIAIIPIMLRSKYCSLTLKKNFDKTEDEYDPGGYFIVNGSEKVVMSLERIVENKPFVSIKKESSSIIHTVQVNSKNYDTDQMQIITARIKKDNNITIKVPILNEIPIFILMRALGIESDKDIINYVVYDSNDTDMTNIVRIALEGSVTESGLKITSQEEAISYLITKMRVIKRYNETDPNIRLQEKKLHLKQLLRDSFLPHIGGDVVNKAYYLGFMINRLLQCYIGRIPIDDRDSFINKRVDLPGTLLFELFKQFYKKMLNDCSKFFKKRNNDDLNPQNIINQIKPNIIESGLKTALLTGAWGKRKGVAQMLQRLSYMQMLSSLRRVNSPTVDASTNKLTSPRHLHPTSVGFICEVETPEGHKVGLVKSLSLMGNVTVMMNDQIPILRGMIKSQVVDVINVSAEEIRKYTKVFLNGEWVGLTKEPRKLYNELKEMKYNSQIDVHTSVIHELKSDIENKELKVYCDGGRLFRPIFRVENNKLLLKKSHVDMISLEDIESSTMVTSWNEFMAKFSGVIEYIDTDEQYNSMLAMFPVDVVDMGKREQVSADMIKKTKIDPNQAVVNRYDDFTFVKFTHCEIHPSMHLGVVVSNIPYCNSNQGPRNMYQYSQAKQAVGLYAANYRERLDISYILYHPQIPIVNTRSAKYINAVKLPAGENVIVAIACYSGYNQEDSVIINQSAIDRGLFRSTTLKKHQTTIQKNQSTSQDDLFIKPDPSKVMGMKHGSYDKLNEFGYVPEETPIVNADIIISKVSPIQPVGNSNKTFKDSSEVYKSHVSGTVDRVWTNVYNNEGYEMRKMRTRSERVPHIGDKVCLRDSAEVLTSEGWIPINEITMDHKVATLEDDQYLKYVKPVDIYHYGYNGKMYKLTSQQVELDVTMDHELYIKKRDRKTFELVIASEVVGKRVRFKKDCVNNMKDMKDIVLSDRDEKHTYSFDAFLELLGTWITDEKQQKTDKMDDIVDKYLSEHNVDTLGKYLPPFVFNLSERQSRVLLTALIRANGSKYKYRDDRYYTSSKRLADDVMRLAIHAGWSGTIKKRDIKGESGTINMDILSIRINKNKNTPQINHGHTKEQNGQKEEIYDYQGDVYCLEVPSHVFMIRENNKNVWIGNCSRHGHFLAIVEDKTSASPRHRGLHNQIQGTSY